MLTSRKKKKIVQDHGSHKTDSGSTPVQIALLTRRIAELTAHLKKNKKDNHSRRGLLQMVGRRRRLLNYLGRTDNKSYNSLIKNLGLKR